MLARRGGRGRTLVAGLLEQRLDPGRERGRDRVRQRRRRGHDLHAQDRREIVAVEGRLTSEHLVGEDADGVEIAALVDLAARGLLGAHVARGAKDHARAGQDLGGAIGVEQLGDAEVDDLGDLAAVEAPRHEHVLGLEIAVDDAAVVGVLEPGQDLVEDLAGRLGLPRLAEAGAELLADEQLHDQVLDARLRGPEVGHADAVGVVEARGALGLAIEALADRAVRADVGVEDLDRDVALEGGVPRAVDGAHAPSPEQRVDAVVIVEDLADEGLERRRHGRAQLPPESELGLRLARSAWAQSSKFAWVLRRSSSLLASSTISLSRR
ncbi:hypothetical protein ENSA5_05430 [Enhygromyxa salina]|uniref:Uncharacterized protein n=1 Tax=Enhygromyxa salina TaxID=215803 RepID=A0A2S9YHV8_9BACT|nr:hypothetical protein ENSA5_05430 [Enhygromyxa salina]